MTEEDRKTYLLSAALFAILAGAMLLGISITRSIALPNPEWELRRMQAERNGDAQRLRVHKFVSTAGTLRYPTSYPNVLPGATYHASCCGSADAYEADDLQVVTAPDGTAVVYAILTCNEPSNCEAVPGKIVRAQGTKIRIPPEKILVNRDPVNDTGHGWVWLSPYTTGDDGQPVVFCYSEPTLL